MITLVFFDAPRFLKSLSNPYLMLIGNKQNDEIQVYFIIIQIKYNYILYEVSSTLLTTLLINLGFGNQPTHIHCTNHIYIYIYIYKISQLSSEFQFL